MLNQNYSCMGAEASAIELLTVFTRNWQKQIISS